MKKIMNLLVIITTALVMTTTISAHNCRRYNYCNQYNSYCQVENCNMQKNHKHYDGRHKNCRMNKNHIHTYK